MPRNPNHQELAEPYEDITVAIALIRQASEILMGHSETDELDSIANRLNEERLDLLGNGKERPFHVSDIVDP